MSDSDFPLPPVTFEYITASIKMEAEMRLGLLRLDMDEPPQMDLRLARHSIDMLAMLEQKTKGNLTMEEQRFIENSLTELRFRFVQALEKRRLEEHEAASAAPAQAETKPLVEVVSETGYKRGREEQNEEQTAS